MYIIKGSCWGATNVSQLSITRLAISHAFSVKFWTICQFNFRVVAINNGNTTEWSPIRSVTIRVDMIID